MDDDQLALARSAILLSLQQAAAATQPLRLHSFSSNIACARLLSALPAAQLTCLDLSLARTVPEDPPLAAITSAISKLQNLRTLQLLDGETAEVGACLAGTAQLCHLTTLRLEDSAWDSLSSLPQQLQCLVISSDEPEMLLDISHLSALKELQISIDMIAEGSALPCSLTSLSMTRCNPPLQELSQLSCLQRLGMTEIVSDNHLPVLACVAGNLPGLHCLSLSYVRSGIDCWRVAVAAASHWCQVPQLKELALSTPSWARAADVTAVLQGMTAATSLTKLVLDGVSNVDLCGYVTCLPGLVDLEIRGGVFSRENALRLTCLTQVTSLRLILCPAVDDAVAVALAHNNQQLQVLALDFCGMVSDSLLPVLRSLQQLRSLSLNDCKGLKDESWELLAQLTQLTKLRLGGNAQLREACRASLREVLGSRVHFVTW